MTAAPRHGDAGDDRDLRREALDRLRRGREPIQDMSAADLASLVHELDVHQVELEIQNEELRRIQLELEVARDRYRDLYEFAPVGYLTLDKTGVIRQANLTAGRLCGRQRGQMIGRRFETLLIREDRDACYKALRQAAAEGKHTPELRFRGPEETVFWALTDIASSGAAPSVRSAAFRVTITDVTERKEAERQLRAHKEQLEQIVAHRTDALRRRAEQLAELTGQLAMAEQRERQRISSILHDHLQQVIVAARYAAGTARRRSADDRSTEILQRLEAQLAEAAAVARGLSHELDPPRLKDGDLSTAVQWLAERMAQSHGLTVAFHGETIPPVSAPLAVLLYSAAQELLFNVAKHAETDAAELRLDADAARITLVVCDQGRGFDPEQLGGTGPAGGFGLMAIRERLALVGGRLEIDSRPGRGSRLTLIAPRVGESRDGGLD